MTNKQVTVNVYKCEKCGGAEISTETMWIDENATPPYRIQDLRMEIDPPRLDLIHACSPEGQQ